MNTISRSPKNRQDILVYSFAGFSTFMWKDHELWLRLDDVWHFLNDQQRQALLSSGVGLFNLPDEPLADGEYILFDVFAALAPENVKPVLAGVKMGVLSVFARGGGK